MPGEIHPSERIKEFTLDDPGLGWPLKLRPMYSMNPVEKGFHVYRGGICDRVIAEAVESFLIGNTSLLPIQILH